MKLKPGFNDVLWMAAGAAALAVCILVVWHFHNDATPAAQLAFKARRADLVGRMQLDLASAAEAEKSAVLAITDQDSQTLADQSRANSAKVEQEQRELGELLATGGTQGEKDLLAQFATAFAEFQRIDKAVLDLAVKNTNLKAYSLAYGPATAAIKELDAALAHSPTPAATEARVGAWRLLALLPPHIAEESDAKMDAMEAEMTKADQQIRHALDELAVPAAQASYEKFSELRAQILKLSRENTNVRSLSISLNQKRKVMLVCQDALGALQRAILAEPIAGITDGTPSLPR